MGNDQGRPPGHREVRSGQWLTDPNRPAKEPAAPPEPGPQPPPEPEIEPLGTPRQEARDAEPIDEAESLLALARSEYEREPEIDPAELIRERSFSLAGLLRKTGLTSLIVGLTGLALLILASEGLAFITALNSLPEWARWGGYGLAGLLCLIVLICLIRFLAAYFRLKSSPRVSWEALRALSARSDLRRQAAAMMDQAKDRLGEFLREYPLETEADKAALARVGFTPENIELLARNKAQLLESMAEESCQSWLVQFENRFVVLLDRSARKRISRYGWLVGIKTAAAPTGFVDAAIVLINAYRLMGDLCRIYRLRAGGVGTGSILVRIFINAFAAARLEEWMDQATHHIVENAAQGSDGMAAFFKVISGGVLSRAAEGGANAFLLIRLGAAGIHYLRPMVEGRR